MAHILPDQILAGGIKLQKVMRLLFNLLQPLTTLYAGEALGKAFSEDIQSEFGEDSFALDAEALIGIGVK